MIGRVAGRWLLYIGGWVCACYVVDCAALDWVAKAGHSSFWFRMMVLAPLMLAYILGMVTERMMADDEA